MYLDYNLMPSCPAPWTSINEGEAWAGGDYFMLFESFPLSWEYMEMKEEGKKVSPYRMPIVYPYAMLVFHKLDKDHPKPKAFLALTIENAVYNLFLPKEQFLELKNDSPGMIDDKGWGPAFFCMFKSSKHMNFGLYNGKMDSKSVLNFFLAKLIEELDINIEVKKIGTIRDAFGSPLTGLPPLADKV